MLALIKASDFFILFLFSPHEGNGLTYQRRWLFPLKLQFQIQVVASASPITFLKRVINLTKVFLTSLLESYSFSVAFWMLFSSCRLVSCKYLEFPERQRGESIESLDALWESYGWSFSKHLHLAEVCAAVVCISEVIGKYYLCLVCLCLLPW